jgi:hypothetical protein
MLSRVRISNLSVHLEVSERVELLNSVWHLYCTLVVLFLTGHRCLCSHHVCMVLVVAATTLRVESV